MASKPEDQHPNDWQTPQDDWQTPGASSGASSTQHQRPPPSSNIEDFLHGFSSGLAGDVVGAGQIIGSVLPESITGPISRSTIGRRLSEEANRPAHGFGYLGEALGGGAPFLIQPELGIGRAVAAVPRIGRYLKPLWDVVRNATLPAAVQPAESQRQRLINMGVGTAAGGALHGAGQGAGKVLSRWANQRQANRVYDAARQAAQVARDQAEQRRDRVTGVNEKISQRNQRLANQHRQAQDTRAQATHLQRVAAQTARDAQAQVPGQTTRNWWREALTPIGEQARAPTTTGPEASAQVRQIIGDRLNQIRGQMRIGREDAGFRTEIDGIRDQVDQRLSSDAMRNQWHYEPEVKFDKDGNPLPPSQSEVARQRNSLWSRYVEQPLENLPELSGRSMADYVSRLGDLAEDFARRARTAPQAERPELEAIARGLRQVVDVVDRRGAADPALRAQLQAAKRSYSLWSIGNGATAAERGGVMTPGSIAREWAGRQGDAHYGAEMTPGHPQYHPENARLKQNLERARQAHETGPPAPTPQPPLRAPQARRTIPVPTLPRVPPERVVSQGVPHAVSRGIGHGVAALTGSPTAGRIAHGIAAYGGRGVARPVLGAARAAGTMAPAVAAGSAKIPELVVTPHGAHWKDEENK